MQPPTFCEKSISSDHSPPDRATPCRPPENRPVPPESSQKTRYGTSRNPRNGAAILAVPRLNLLCSMLLSAHQHGQYSDPVSGRYWFFGGRYMRYAAPILVGLIAMLPPAAHLNAKSARPAFQDNYAEVNGEIGRASCRERV